MTGRFKRMGEKIRQALGVVPKGLAPSSNARNIAMIAEVKRFAMELKALHRDLTGLDKSVETSLGTVKSILNASLPRAFEDSPAGAVVLDAEPIIVGTHVNLEGVTAAGQELKARMQAEVLHPLEQWLAAYRSIKERNRRCEELRLDLDTKRRQSLTSQERYQRLREKNHKDADDAMVKAQTDEDKMNRLAQRYQEVEAEVFNALLTLIRDTSVLREYAAAALAILQRCFTLSYTCFDLNTPMPMPRLPEAAATPPPVAAITYQSSEATASGASYPSPLATARSASTAGHSQNESTGGAPPQAGGSPPAYNHAVPPRAPPSPNADASEGNGLPRVPEAAASVSPLPQAPSWFNDAKKNAKAPAYDENSDSDAEGNPFAAKGPGARQSPAKDTNPFHNSDSDE